LLCQSGTGCVRADDQQAADSADGQPAPASAQPVPSPTEPRPKFTTESVHGRVVWLAEALERRYRVQSVPEAAQRTLALQTRDGQLHPLVEDLRGRSFRKDQRLRDMDLELLVRRYEGSPTLQVLRIYEVQKDSKYLVDYWCDVCAITMFEDGPCDCCQDHNRLRKRRAKPGVEKGQ